MTGTGYREVVRHVAGEWTLERTRAQIRRATRSYARRQLTWFRNQLPPETLTLEATTPLNELVAQVLDAWREAAPEGGG
jgi:tRNA dimethylallyltransferase